MSTCPYCSTEIVEGYNFCVHCDRQVKCRGCGSLLLANKTLCLVCGVPLTSHLVATMPMNEYSLEETQTADTSSRSIKIKFTDNAIDKAGPLLGIQATAPRIIPQPVPVNVVAKALPSGEVNNREVYNGSALNKSEQISFSSSEDSLTERAQRFFEPYGEDQLTAIDPDMRGKSKKEQQQRFALLYVWAYQAIYGKGVPSKTYIVNAARRRKLYDTNFNRHVEHIMQESMTHGDNGYKIIPSQLPKINSVLEEIESGEQKGVAYWKDTPRAGRRRSNSNSSDDGKVEEWLSITTDYDHFDVRSLKKPAEYAMLAIWLITKIIKIEKAVKASDAFAYLKGKFKTIPVNQKQFSSALNRDYNADKFRKTSDNLWYITEEAERSIEALVRGV
jgi:uncharacterized protein (UPF0128 family)